MGLTADQFMQLFKETVSPEVRDERTTFVVLHPGLGPRGRGNAHVTITFINLPTPRVRERRGGGAEAENNRMLFYVEGFNDDPFADEPAEKVKVEQLVNNVFRPLAGAGAESAPSLRRKTCSPERAASYLADYVTQVARDFPPSFTHE